MSGNINAADPTTVMNGAEHQGAGSNIGAGGQTHGRGWFLLA